MLQCSAFKYSKFPSGPRSFPLLILPVSYSSLLTNTRLENMSAYSFILLFEDEIIRPKYKIRCQAGWIDHISLLRTLMVQTGHYWSKMLDVSLRVTIEGSAIDVRWQLGQGHVPLGRLVKCA